MVASVGDLSGVRYYMEMLIESPPSGILDVSNNQGCNIYKNIFSLGETCITNRPLNATSQWRMPCNATLKGKRRQYNIIHTFGYWTNVQIYNIQNTD